MNRVPTQLDNAPLIHVLALVELNPVAEIANFIEAIGQSLRESGYLDVHRSSTPNFKIDVTAQKLDVDSNESWIFTRKDQSRCITLTSNIFALQASVYKHFEPFCDDMINCLGRVLSIVKDFEQVRRIGLRYINLIELKNDTEPNFWIRNELLGSPLSTFGPTPYFSKVERYFPMKTGALVIRLSDLPGQLPIPPGINPSKLLLPNSVKNLRIGERFILLDIDRFLNNRFDINTVKVQESLRGFSEDATRAFFACATDEAISYWEPKYEN